MKRIGMTLLAVGFVFLLSSCASSQKPATLTKVLHGSSDAQRESTLIFSEIVSNESGPSDVGKPSILLDPSLGKFNDLHDPSDRKGVAPEPFIVEELEEPEEEEITYDMPIIQNATVEGHIEYFQTTIKDRFEMWLSRSGRYIPFMKEIFKSYELPEDLVFVALIESGFNPVAYSRARAVGPWQFIHGTGKRYGLRINQWIDERRDPIKSTHAAAKYLKDLYNMFDSWPLALASYNAGEGKVKRAIRRTRSDDFWRIRNTRYLRRETKNYVPKFMAATIIAKNPEKYGFNPKLWEPLRFDEVTVEDPTDLRVIAEAVGVTYKDLKELNPELRSTITPFGYHNYVLKLPSGTKETYYENIAKIPVEKRIIQLRHRVRWGETLSTLARRYGTTIQAIRALNNLGRSNTIHAGHYLLIPMGSETAIKPKRQRPSPTIQASTPKIDAGTKMFRYQVRRGDTLSKLAHRYGTSIPAIRAVNNMGRSHIIQTGQYLKIPLDSRIQSKPQKEQNSKSSRLAATNHPNTANILYKVRRGDTLSSIAKRHGTSIRTLRDLNNLGRSHLIRAGHYLLVPTTSQAEPNTERLQIKHRVRRGDTLITIAGRYATTVSSIRALNDLGHSHMIRAGEYLLVSVGSKTVISQELIQFKHRVRRGETLSSIAKKYRTSVRAIRELNNLGRSHFIRAGQYLMIPGDRRTTFNPERLPYAEVAKVSASKEKKELKKIRYKVRRGDTLWGISKNFDISVSQICKWNRLKPNAILRAGKRLVLYVGVQEI